MLNKTKEAFSHNELKELFIQPRNMDKRKYDKKLARYYNELLPQCSNVLAKN